MLSSTALINIRKGLGEKKRILEQVLGVGSFSLQRWGVGKQGRVDSPSLRSHVVEVSTDFL